MALKVGDLVAILGLDSTQFNTGLKTAGARLEAFGRRLNTIGYSLNRLSLPMAIISGAAVKMATTFRV